MIDIITADKEVILFLIQGDKAKAILVSMKNTLERQTLLLFLLIKLNPPLVIKANLMLSFHLGDGLDQATKVLGRLFPQSSRQLIHASLLPVF